MYQEQPDIHGLHTLACPERVHTCAHFAQACGALMHLPNTRQRQYNRACNSRLHVLYLNVEQDRRTNSLSIDTPKALCLCNVPDARIAT